MNRGQFDILQYLHKNKYISQRHLAEAAGYSLGKTNGIIKELRSNEWIDEDFLITRRGYNELKPYRVDNAIIMAAGMSSRFVPLSLEKPKGLLTVKNEILIERQIEQLQAAGISDITIVLGFKKELFFYLEDKYSVKLLINPEYNVKNNIETLYIARDNLKNTYICSSDNYFSENVFEDYVYQSYYSSIHVKEKTNEWYMVPDEKGNISKVKKSGSDGMIMLGHVFWDRHFSDAFKRMIIEHHEIGDYDSNLWEDLFADNIKGLPPIAIREYSIDTIHEFDSLAELREFDEHYVKDSHSIILKNISKILNCRESDIDDITPIKEGLTNTSFVFGLDNKKYVYRHPGEGTEEIINRAHEKKALELAKELKVDRTYIYEDDVEGWKISEYIEGIRIPDYDNFDDSKRVIGVMRKLHSSKVVVEWGFEPWEEACRIGDIIRKYGSMELKDFEILKTRVEKCYEMTKNDGVKKVFCHCDTYAPNWMITEKEAILIDWEYAGNADPGCDVGGYIMDAMYDVETAKTFIVEYLGEKNDKLIIHFLAYVAIVSYYWFVWALYRESCGGVMGESLHNWYVMAKRYSNYLTEEKGGQDGKEYR